MDDLTEQHGIRVAKKSIKFGKMINLSDKKIKNLYIAALFHDIGKVLLDQGILNKPSKLTDEEMEAVQMHPVYSYYGILQAGYAKEIAITALYHHENYDGTGYPEGLSGTSIPIEARILRIVDVFDALTSDRPYREKLTINRALEIMETERSSYDPELYSLLLDRYANTSRSINEIKEVNHI